MTESLAADKRVVRGDATRVPALYSNATGVLTSGYDLVLQFFREYPDAEAGTLIHELVGQVHLPHAQAWVVAQIILDSLSKIVASNGPFSVPKDVLDRFELGERLTAFLGQTQ